MNEKIKAIIKDNLILQEIAFAIMLLLLFGIIFNLNSRLNLKDNEINDLKIQLNQEKVYSAFYFNYLQRQDNLIKGKDLNETLIKFTNNYLKLSSLIPDANYQARLTALTNCIKKQKGVLNNKCNLQAFNLEARLYDLLKKDNKVLQD